MTRSFLERISSMTCSFEVPLEVLLIYLYVCLNMDVFVVLLIFLGKTDAARVAMRVNLQISGHLLSFSLPLLRRVPLSGFNPGSRSIVANKVIVAR